MNRIKISTLSLPPITGGLSPITGCLRLGASRLRIFCDQSAKPEGFEPSIVSAPNRMVMLRGGSGAFVDLEGERPGDHLTVHYERREISVPIAAPRPSLLAGEDCVISLVNHALPSPDLPANPQADPGYLINWMAHHAREHQASAFFFLNRLGPGGEGAEFGQLLAKAARRQDPIPNLRHILLLDLPMPTGRLTQGDERDLFYAPGAPGKGRMAQPSPDHWRAAFGEGILLDYIRLAYMSQANGVTYLEPSDWLAPADRSIFELAREAKPHPAIAMEGQRAYPWKLPNSGEARPGDHICQTFDSDSRYARWAVSPARSADLDQIWRPHRIIGLRQAAAKHQKLWRFMGLRHPGGAPAQLAPKSSLREDPELLAFSTETLGHEPFRIPAPDIDMARIAAPALRHSDKVVIVTAMKNEGPFLLEWIAYHRAIGVTNFIVFSNDCTDGTDVLLDLLAARGIIEHYPNPFREMNLKPQHAGFRAAEQLQTVQQADWLMTLDVDEFINIHTGEGHLRDLFAAVGHANMISCTWRLFGNDDIAAFEDKPVISQFTRCASKGASRPHQAWGFKTLYQNNGIFKKLGVHRPKGLNGQAANYVNWVNGSGEPMPPKEYRTGWRSGMDTVGYDLVTLNHYAVRSVESFLVKRDRGRVNHVDRDQGTAYWFRMNHNTTTDHSIQRMSGALAAQLAELTDDPQIAAAHKASVAHHKKKIAELLAQHEPKAFATQLMGERYRKLSRLLPAFGSNVFLAGPDSVPREVIDQLSGKPIPKDFYFTVPRPEETNH